MQHPGEAAGAWKEKAEGETRRQGLGVPESLRVMRYLRRTSQTLGNVLSAVWRLSELRARQPL